jgi:signal peptidase
MRILAEPGRAARARSRPARIVPSILLATVIVAILVVIAGMVLGVWRFSVIDTGSMRPTLNPGDVAVLRPESIAELKPGQIVAFHPPGEPRLTVLHRVFSVQRSPNGVVIQTKGDANNTTDQWHARIIARTVWLETVKAPKIGYLAVWSHKRGVRLAVLILAVALAVSILLGSIWRPRPVAARQRTRSSTVPASPDAGTP